MCPGDARGGPDLTAAEPDGGPSPDRSSTAFPGAGAEAGRPLRRDAARGLRPAEAVAVTLPDCELPTEGSRIVVHHAPWFSVGKKWTDSGQNHDLRGLKARPPGGTRTVPLPHELVSLWRESVDTFGTADDGRLFFNEKGGIVGSTTYDRAWHEARELALSPGLMGSPSPYAPTTCGSRCCPPG